MLRDATARVAPGSAPAKVRVLWCVEPDSGSPIGTALGPADEFCGDTPDLDGQRLEEPSVDNRFSHLVVEVVPLVPGEITIEGAQVAYTAGLQRGSQSSGVVVKVKATPADG